MEELDRWQVGRKRRGPDNRDRKSRHRRNNREVPNSTPEDVDLAVQAAKRSFYDGRWTGLLRGERQRMLWRLGELVEQKAEELARVESENTGNRSSI